MLTQERVKQLFDYDHETGFLIRLTSVSPNTRAGDIVGVDNGTGYLQVSIDYKIYLVHRVIWLWVYGKFPEDQIDHKNHIRSDNRIRNLRDATRQENDRNQSMQKNNTSGVIGVSWRKPSKKWRALITVNGKQIYLGSFKDKSEAAAVRLIAEIKYGFHENHGK